jgi:hypothetical protein
MLVRVKRKNMYKLALGVTNKNSDCNIVGCKVGSIDRIG